MARRYDGPVDRTPLLVTGLPRSGTSWTGKMLEASGGVVYVNEPMNPRRPPGRSPGVLNARVEHPFHYVDPKDDQVWEQAFRDTLALRYHALAELKATTSAYDVARMAKYGPAFFAGRLRGRRAMLDDPYAILSSRWLTERMGVRSAVLVRDPVSLLGSWRSLGWRVVLEDIYAQPALVRDLISPWLPELEQASASDDWVLQMCTLWNVVHEVVTIFRDEVEGLTVWRYEDLASDPLAEFAALYAWFGLSWTDAVRDRIEAATSAPTQPTEGFAWSLRGGLSRTAYQPMDSRSAAVAALKRLSPADVERVRDLTAVVAERFGYPTVRS